MTTYFTSDVHFGHRKVAALRGFHTYDGEPDVLRHDLAIVDRWRESIRDDDIVWVLGDLSAGGSGPTRHALATLAGLPGRKRLIAGNHDPIHPMNREAFKWSQAFAKVFEYVAPFARAKVLGVEVMLSHFPYERDRHEARYMQYRLRDEGLPLLHGHTHGEERFTRKPIFERGWWRTEIHVGVDAWNLAPVADTTVLSLLSKERVNA